MQMGGLETRDTDESSQIDLGLVLSDFQWKASGDATALEARLLSELHALEAVLSRKFQQSPLTDKYFENLFFQKGKCS